MKYKLTLADDNGTVVNTYYIDHNIHKKYSYDHRNMNDMNTLLSDIIRAIDKHIDWRIGIKAKQKAMD